VFCSTKHEVNLLVSETAKMTSSLYSRSSIQAKPL
jgi:hypothetical protein